MTTLCERCFPRWASVEVLTMPALVSCDGCGALDRRHVYRRDPRGPGAAGNGIPVPLAKHCEFRERAMSYETEYQVLCTYRVPGGPRFRACQTMTDERRYGLLPSELRREVPRMHHLALRDVQEQVRAHNAVILPIPND